MPMQVTKTTPLFAAALRPEATLRATGGWVALAVAAVVGAPILVAVPEFALPGVAAFGLAGGGLAGLSVRHARRRKLVEQVTLWQDQLEISATDAAGNRRLLRFEPQAVRLVLERDENECTQAIRLRAPGETVEIGAFLSSDDKASFAKAFGSALRRARR